MSAPRRRCSRRPGTCHNTPLERCIMTKLILSNNLTTTTAAFALLLLTTAAAHAQSMTMYTGAGLPPLEYDHPYKSKLNVVTAGAAVMRRACPRSSMPITLACSYAEKDECLIIMLEDNLIVRSGWTPEIVYRHERGHCLFWPGDHKGARMADNNDHKKIMQAKEEMNNALSRGARMVP